MMAGSASAMAACAAVRLPVAMASSTLRTALRRRERRALLITVRRAIWRAAFLADFVLAMLIEPAASFRMDGTGAAALEAPGRLCAAYRGRTQRRQRVELAR